MSRYTRHHSKSTALSSWHGDAKKTMLENPDYFVWWYTVKSVGLGVVFGAAMYLLGKQHAQRKRRK